MKKAKKMFGVNKAKPATQFKEDDHYVQPKVTKPAAKAKVPKIPKKPKAVKAPKKVI